MRIAKDVPVLLAGVALFLAVSCTSSSTDANELAERARDCVARQEAQALTLVHALTSAQRGAANASWDSILNAAAQNYRHRHGMALDEPLTDDQHDEVRAIADKNLASILDHVAKSEAALIEAIGFDYSSRARLIEELVRSVDGAIVRQRIRVELDRLDDLRRSADVDVVDPLFKRAVAKQTGYVGG